jgi:hypothetical protein
MPDNWTYAGWRNESGAAAKLAMLNDHIAEVSNRIGNETGADGFSEGSSSLVQYLNTLREDARDIERDTRRAGGMSFVRLGKAR